MRTCKAKGSEPGLYFRAGHKEFPEQPGPVIFDHDHHGSLINGQVILCVPVLGEVKGVVEPIRAPQPLPVILIKITKGLHGVFRRIGQGGDGGSRTDHSQVVGGAVGRISLMVVAGRKAPV